MGTDPLATLVPGAGMFGVMLSIITWLLIELRRANRRADAAGDSRVLDAERRAERAEERLCRLEANREKG